MARALTAALKAEFLKSQLQLITLVDIEFVSGTVYLWTGLGDLAWGGNTYQGVGTLGRISDITESSEVQANGIELALSGIPTELLNEALGEVRPNKRVRVWLGALDASGAVIVDPYLSFVGFTDVPTVEDSGDTCTISLTCEPRWVDRRVRVWRYTQQDQNVLSPGDTGFRFLKDIDKPKYWGKNTPVFGKAGRAPCFTGPVGIRTPAGIVPIGTLPRRGSFWIENETGRHLAELLVHDFAGFMLPIAEPADVCKLVTFDHLMRDGVAVVPARKKWPRRQPVWFEGEVFNLHILSDRPDDLYYVLETGDVAHNAKAEPIEP